MERGNIISTHTVQKEAIDTGSVSNTDRMVADVNS